MKSLDACKELGAWIHAATTEFTIPNKEREKVSATILQHALDIGDAIVFLISINLVGPAFALARAHFENYVCGVWLLNHAKEAQLESFKNGKPPGLQSMLKVLDKSKESGEAWIHKFAVLNLSSFHCMAHSSYEHAIRRVSNDGSTIEPSYAPEEIERLLRECMTIQIGAVAYTLALSSDENKINALAEKADAFRKLP